MAEEVAAHVVRRVLRAAGIETGTSRKPVVHLGADHRLADPAWLAAKYGKKSGAQIAQELGCSQYEVFGALKRAGIARRTRQERVRLARGIEPWPIELRECVIGLYGAGKTGKEVAVILQLKPSAVYKQLREWGITRSIGEGRRLKKERTAE